MCNLYKIYYRWTDVVDVSIFIALQHTIQLKEWLTKESLGQLVVLGFAIAGFTPAPYQRRRLQRPLYGVLILRMASHLDAFSAYPNQT